MKESLSAICDLRLIFLLQMMHRNNEFLVLMGSLFFTQSNIRRKWLIVSHELKL
jgi:hypothetical protein